MRSTYNKIFDIRIHGGFEACAGPVIGIPGRPFVRGSKAFRELGGDEYVTGYLMDMSRRHDSFWLEFYMID